MWPRLSWGFGVVVARQPPVCREKETCGTCRRLQRGLGFCFPVWVSIAGWDLEQQRLRVGRTPPCACVAHPALRVGRGRAVWLCRAPSARTTRRSWHRPWRKQLLPGAAGLGVPARLGSCLPIVLVAVCFGRATPARSLTLKRRAQGGWAVRCAAASWRSWAPEAAALASVCVRTPWSSAVGRRGCHGTHLVRAGGRLGLLHCQPSYCLPHPPIITVLTLGLKEYPVFILLKIIIGLHLPTFPPIRPKLGSPACFLC